MKKAAVLLAALILVLSMVGCASAEPREHSFQFDDSGIKVTFTAPGNWHIYKDNNEIYITLDKTENYHLDSFFYLSLNDISSSGATNMDEAFEEMKKQLTTDRLGDTDKRDNSYITDYFDMRTPGNETYIGLNFNPDLGFATYSRYDSYTVVEIVDDHPALVETVKTLIDSITISKI